MSGDSELEKRKRRDFEDQQNELAGRDTGRMVRFGVGLSQTRDAEEKKRKERAYRDALDRLLASDPEYRMLYEALGDRLGEAEATADQTIEAIQAALATQEDVNQDMRDRAPKIGGKAVFRYADGRVVDEDGRQIDAVVAAGIVWPANAPSAEDYFSGLARASNLRASLDDWQSFRNVTLGDLRNRYDDRDNPMSKDDLRDALTEIERARPAVFNVEIQDKPEKSSADIIPSAFPVLPLASQ